MTGLAVLQHAPNFGGKRVWHDGKEEKPITAGTRRSGANLRLDRRADDEDRDVRRDVTLLQLAKQLDAIRDRA